MNVKFEILENHRARIVVEPTQQQLDKAKKRAAQKISERYKIPGFRQGKAPYKVVAKYFGEETVMEETIEQLVSDIYPDALHKSDLNPFGPGTLESYELEPVMSLTFTLPLMPKVTIGDYYSLRVPYEPPTASEEEVDHILNRMRQEQATRTPSGAPIQEGNHVLMDIHSYFVDGEDAPEDERNRVEGVYYKGDYFYRRNDVSVYVEFENDPVVPGFFKVLHDMQAKQGDKLTFDYEVPDVAKYAVVKGRKVAFEVLMREVNTLILPELDDTFAARQTPEGAETWTLEDLRESIRLDINQELEDQYEEDYEQNVLDAVVAISEIIYPYEMVEARRNEMLQRFKQDLERGGISYTDYLIKANTSEAALLAEYEESAHVSIKRNLVMLELMLNEQLTPTKQEVDARLQTIADYFGISENKRLIKGLFTDEYRRQIASSLSYEKVMEFLVKICKGEYVESAQDAAETPDDTTDTTETNADEPSAEVKADVSQAHDETKDSES